MRVCSVGTGFHGRRVAKLVTELGGEVVAAVSAGDQVGRTIGSVQIGSDVATELDRIDAKADVAIIIVPGPPQLEEQLAGPCLDRGVNVITLSPEAFYPPPDWAQRMDSRAKAGGASMLATGVQDLWWVHIPATAAASVANLTAIKIESSVNLGELAAGLAHMLQLGAPAERFAAVSELVSAGAPILGGALAALARRLDLGSGTLQTSFEPVLAERELRHPAADIIVAEGTIAGLIERSRLETASGIVLEGEAFTRLFADDDVAQNTTILDGDPPLRLDQAPFPGLRITDVAAVTRIRDVVAAPPSLLDVAQLAPPAALRSLS